MLRTTLADRQRSVKRSGGYAVPSHDRASRALSRPPNEVEQQALVEYLHQQQRIFERNPDAAIKWFPIEMAGFTRAETAAWVGATSVLLNLDEFITRE